jgi:hypothetical protein
MEPNPYKSPLRQESGDAKKPHWELTIAGALAVVVLVPLVAFFCWWAFQIVTSLLELRPPA